MNDIDQIADCLDALGNSKRLELFRLLVPAGEQGKTVGQIQEALAIPASTLSHHLKHLELVGLVHRGKKGTTHCVSANYEKMDFLITFLTRECCAEQPDNTHRAHWHKDCSNVSKM